MPNLSSGKDALLKMGRLGRRLEPLHIVLILLGGLFLTSAWQTYTTTRRLEVLGATGFPLIVSALLLLGVAALAVYEALKPPPATRVGMRLKDIKTIRCLVLVALSVLYVFVVEALGFVITSIFYEVALMACLGATQRLHLVIAIVLSVVLTFAIYLSYTMLFQIPVPGVL